MKVRSISRPISFAIFALILFPFYSSIYIKAEGVKLIINQMSFESDSIRLVGSKAASLHHLQQVPNIKIPQWFCLTTNMFKKYLEINNIDDEIKKLDVLSQQWFLESAEGKKLSDKKVYHQAAIVKSLILDSKINEEFCNEIKVEYQNLIDSCGYYTSVAVRSSGIIEDLPDSSFAGIYDTFLNQKNEESLISSVKECWASVFNDRAVFERNSRNIKHHDALTSVIVQQMIDAKAAGTAFNMEIGTGYDGIEIAANYGLGESVVGGEVSVDKWLVHRNSNRIIKSVLGNKKFKIVWDPNNSGVETIPSNDDEKNQYVLETDMVREISSKVKEIANHYLNKFSYSHIDTEFAVDNENQLYFLQARPLVAVGTKEINVLDKEDSKSHALIAHGLYSVPGVASGKIKFIPSWAHLADGRLVIEPDDIVVTYASTVYWSQYMTNFKGMITLEGGPTSHPILLCRVRKVPCVIGIQQNVFEKLKEYDGRYVTIDGINQNIYEGEIKFKAGSPEDFAFQFEMPKEEAFQSADELKLFELIFVEKNNGDEVLWHSKPSHPLDKILQEINLIAFSKNAELLGLGQGGYEVKVLNNYVVEKYRSAEEKFHEFSKFDLKYFESYIANQEEACNQYLQLCHNFTLTVENWKKYIDLTSEIRSYMIPGFNFRDYVGRQAVREANRLQIPKHYLEAYSEQLQSQIVEEDSLIVKEIHELALKINNIPTSKAEGAVSLAKLKEKTPEIYQELEMLAKHYRFKKNTSYIHDLDVEIAFKRILLEIESFENSGNVSGIAATEDINNVSTEYYFPQDDDLRRWMYLGVTSRILQSDSHHKLMRGQWSVREALLELGTVLTEQRELDHPKEIFNLSLNQISNYIQAN
ncbi:MAG: hypothetical protein H0U49_12775 [Parachlamydiaceae bacterium]|nr:hypothetical protein [Parachlamydiaceae bacterium]